MILFPSFSGFLKFVTGNSVFFTNDLITVSGEAGMTNTVEFSVSNYGLSSLDVVGIKSSCGCDSVLKFPCTVGPLGSVSGFVQSHSENECKTDIFLSNGRTLSFGSEFLVTD